MQCRRMIVGLMVTLFAGGAAGDGLAQGTSVQPGPRMGSSVVEGVAAVIGDHAVMRSQVEEQFEILAPQFQVDPGDTSQANQLRREILDNLVSEQLLKQEAEAQGLKVDEEQIKQAVEEGIRADRERLGEEGFLSQLAAEGLTETELRAIYSEDLRNEFLRRQLIQREVFSKISITDAQVERHFQENREKIGKKPRALRVLDLFMRTMPDSAIEKTYRRRAEEVYDELKAGLSFEEAVRRYSDDSRSAEQGGMLGRFAPGDLGDRSFEQAAFENPIGTVSEPIRTNLGYHLMEVVDRDPSGAWCQVRHILIGVMPSRSDEQRTRERMMRIRDEIVSGRLDFATAVSRYSDDPPSRGMGGDVGWLPIDNFLGETRAVVESLRMGEVSDVAAVEGGFHIFKLIGEQAETDYNFEEIRGELRNIVELEERQARLEEYLAELRTKIYVEIRPFR